jgi:phage-related holin
VTFLLEVGAVLQQGIKFTFGRWHPLTGTIFVFVLLNIVWDCFRRYKGMKEAIIDIAKKLGLYLTYGAVAHQFDRLVMSSLLEFEDGTLFFAALYVLKDEIKHLLATLKQMGIKIPGVFTNRVDMLDDLYTSGPPTAKQIQEKIMELKKSIEVLKDLQDNEDASANHEPVDMPEKK